VGDHAEAAATMIAKLVLFHLALARLDGKSAAETLMMRSLTIGNTAIYCARVAGNSVMV
jgi:hypothetical protein